MNIKHLSTLLLLSLSFQAAAELPLSLEELLTDKGKLRLESSISYTNIEREQTRLANPIYIQTGANSYIAVPTALQQGSRNSDLIIGTLGLRYGITAKTELYGNASYLWRNDRTYNGAANSHSSDNLSNISLGISHTFKQDGKNPALIGFAETTTYEKSYGKASSAKSWQIGATTYKAIDPIVLSLTGSYHISNSKNITAGKYKAGNYFTLNPSISFAANDRISITGGVQWIAQQPSRLNSEKLAARNTATYAHFGVGYGISRETSISASARFNVSGQSNSTLRLSLQHTF